MKKRILVTGCAGFIGSHLCEKLLALDYAVVGIDNFDSFYARALKEENMAGFVAHPAFTFYEVDLRKPDFYSNFDAQKIATVIHLAGKAGVRPSIANPQEYLESNITATLHVLQYMVDKKINRLIFGSSSSVYGNANSAPFKEDGQVDRPISPYAFTKRSCELLNQTYHQLYGLNILNLRFFTVYGPRQRPDLAINKFVHLMRRNKPIPMFGDGSSLRDYTYITDIINGIIMSVKLLETRHNFLDTINLGNNYPVSLQQLIERLSRICQAKPKILVLPKQAGDVEITCASTKKAQSLLGYVPTVRLDDGLAHFFRWYVARYGWHRQPVSLSEILNKHTSPKTANAARKKY